MILDCLKHMEEYDPVGAVLATQKVWLEFAEAAGVSLKELRTAYARVYWDGYYGPCTDDEWEEAHGDNMPMKKAIAILHTALEHTPHVQYTHPDHGYCCDGKGNCHHPDHQELEDPGPMFHEEPLEVDTESIKRSWLPAIREIYGGWL